MTVELNPVGIKCNLACSYCYETEMREAGNYGPKDYDLGRMQAGLLGELGAHGKHWTLHGGEPFLMDLGDLRAMWQWGAERGHQLGAQTNGALVTDEHIELARRYRVHMGFSIDGPDSMNDLRSRSTLVKTRAATEASLAALKKCCERGVSCSVI